MIRLPPSKARRRSSGGAVAVEFALVLPIFLIIMAMIIAFGQAMWARSQMLNFITSAGRVCTMQLPVNAGIINSCLDSRLSTFKSQRLVGTCVVGDFERSYTKDNVRGTDIYQPSPWILYMRLSCKIASIPFAGILQSGSQNGINVRVDGSFPYLPNNSNGLAPSNGP